MKHCIKHVQKYLMQKKKKFKMLDSDITLGDVNNYC